MQRNNDLFYPKVSKVVEKNSFGSFFGSQFVTPQTSSQKTIVKTIRNQKDVEKEMADFQEIISNADIINYIMSSADFWNDNKNKFPIFYKFIQIIMNIPATSAMLERFFSITGIICDKRRLNMNIDLIIMRCMFKANMILLNEIHKNE